MEYIVNPLRTELPWEDMEMYIHIISFQDIGMA